jgi:hypothetical protein
MEPKRAANLANILYHWIYFYVNNPKTTAEFFPPEANFGLLTLFKGGVTLINKILCTFVAK